MVKINRLKKYFLNALIVSGGGIVLQVINVCFNIFVTWKIGAEAFGLFTLSRGVYGFGITLATSGINLAVVRLVSAVLPYNENDKSLKNRGGCVANIMKNATIYALSFSLFSTFIFLSFAKLIGVYLINDVRIIPSIKIMAFSLVPIALSSVINGYFCAVRRAYKNVIVQFIEQGIKISSISLLLVVLAPSGIEYACLSLALGGLLSELFSVLINVILYFLERKKQFKSDFKNCDGFSKVFSSAFPVAVSAYVRSALSTVEGLSIPWGLKRSGLGAAKALSSYGVLHGMVFPLIFFPSSVLGAFSSLLVPEIASSYEAKDFSRIKRIVSYVFGFSLLFSLGVSGIFISFSNEIGLYFFKNEDAGNLVRLLSPLIPLMYLDFAVDSLLKGLGEQIYSMRVNIIDSLVSVILIFILVPIFGINGYITVIFITELLNTSLSIYKLLKKTELKPKILKWIVKPTINIVLSTLLCRLTLRLVQNSFPFFKEGKISVILCISACAVFYLIFSRVTGAIEENDLLIFKG